MQILETNLNFEETIIPSREGAAATTGRLDLMKEQLMIQLISGYGASVLNLTTDELHGLLEFASPMQAAAAITAAVIADLPQTFMNSLVGRIDTSVSEQANGVGREYVSQDMRGDISLQTASVTTNFVPANTNETNATYPLDLEISEVDDFSGLSIFFFQQVLYRVVSELHDLKLEIPHTIEVSLEKYEEDSGVVGSVSVMVIDAIGNSVSVKGFLASDENDQ